MTKVGKEVSKQKVSMSHKMDNTRLNIGEGTEKRPEE